MLCKMEAKSYLKCEDASLSKKIINTKTKTIQKKEKEKDNRTKRTKESICFWVHIQSLTFVWLKLVWISQERLNHSKKSSKLFKQAPFKKTCSHQLVN